MLKKRLTLKEKTRVVADKPHIGKELLRIRKEKGMSQTAFAEKAGVTAAAVCNYEKGFRIPYLSSFHLICKALEVNADTLLETCELTPLIKQ